MIEGSYGLPSMAKPYDIVDYDYIRKHGVYGLNMNESLKILLVDNQITGDPGRFYPNTRIIGIYELPYRYDTDLIIQSVDQDGTIHIVNDNQPIELKTEDTWASPTRTWIKNESGKSLNGSEWSYKARYNSTQTLKNIGIFDKGNIGK